MTDLDELLGGIPSEPIDDREIEAQVAIRTYYVYIKAFTIKTGDLEELKKRQDDLQAFKNLTVSKTNKVDRVKQSLYRGWLTLKALKVLPVSDYPALATTANFWAPVQAYYAAHGLGMAALAALGDNPPQNHRSFRAAATNQIVNRLIPYPFNISCTGNPSEKKGVAVAFEDCSVDVAKVRKTSSLENPFYSNQEGLIAKALMTTRNRLLAEMFNDARRKKIKKGKMRRNLPSSEKTVIAGKLHPTSIFDFLYRIRVRSNYDDPEMYIYGQGDEATAQNHYKNLLQLTADLAAVLERVIERKVGVDGFQRLVTEFGK